MNQPQNQPPSPPGDLEGEQLLLTELEDAIREGLSLAIRDDLEPLLVLVEKADKLLDLAAQVRFSGSPERTERIRRIERLHHQLSLTVAQKRKETSDKLDQMRKGKGAIRAYGNGRR